MTTAAELIGAGLRVDHAIRLHPTDVSIRRGAVTGILGCNGSGKSTLLGLLAGELTPSEGRALIADQDPAALRHTERARLRALLTQETHVAFGFAVEQVVAWGRAPWRRTAAAAEDAEVIEECIAEQDLAALRTRPVTSLSGGERKRVHLARVLAQRAPLLLLDEADSDLDLVGRQRLDETMAAHARAGNAAVIASHDVVRMGRTCDDIVLLRAGRVVAAGRCSDVFTRELLTETFGMPVTLP